INIEKSTNGQDADNAPGPTLNVSASVIWTYTVTNTGNVALTNVVVMDDQIGLVAGPSSGDFNNNNLLDVNEVWVYAATGTVTVGQYVNTGVVTAVSLIGQSVSDNDPSHYFGGQGGISIEKTTNDEDADNAPGVIVLVGSTVTWTYVVSNIGNVAISNIVVEDDQIGLITNLVSGDLNHDSILDTNEVWIFTATGLAEPDQYANIGSVSGVKVNTDTVVSDTDPSHYFGSNPGIKIEKATNGQDADVAPGPILPVGSSVVWSYVVTNTGNVALTNVVVTDDQIGLIVGPSSGDLNGNGLLDVYEVWIYSATGTVAAGQYVNTGLVTAVTIFNQPLSDSDPSHYFGAMADFVVSKTRITQTDNDAFPGDLVTFVIEIENVGNADITSLPVQDVYETNYLQFVSAIPPPDDAINDGVLDWTNIGPLPVGSSTSVVVNFSAVVATWGYKTNRVTSTPELPPGFPELFTKTNEAPYEVLAFAGVGDFVWLDFNEDGIQDPFEPGMPFVRLILYNSSNVIVGITTSAVFGVYAFTNLLPGDYYIKVHLTPGAYISPQFQGLDPAKDSNVDPLNLMTPIFTLSAGEFNDTIDFGIFRVVNNADNLSVSGRTENGIPCIRWETEGEYGVAGWYIERMDENGQWVRVSEMLAIAGHIYDGGVYTWTDMSAIPGEAYQYRFIQIDVRGREKIVGAYEIQYPKQSRNLHGAETIGYSSSPRSEAPAPLSAATKNAILSGYGIEPEALKISVRTAGLYRITLNDLALAFGVEPSAVSNMPLRLTHLGRDVAYHRNHGDVVFYGKSYESIYTDVNIYRLSKAEGLLISHQHVAPAVGAPQPWYIATKILEQQNNPRPDLFENADGDFWLWRLIVSGGIPQAQQFTTTLNLPDLAAGTGGEISVKIKGSSQPLESAGFHGARIELNGTPLGSTTFFGLNHHTFTVQAPPGLWQESGNQLRIVSEPLPGVISDQFYLDGYEILYKRKFKADSGQLLFSAEAGSVAVDGFNNSNAEIWNISDPWSPIRMTGFGSNYTGSSWSYNFEAVTSANYVVADTMLFPLSVEPWDDNNLKLVSHQVDYLVIYGPGLQSGAQALADYRSNQGLITKVVPVDHIFNAFNHGIRDGRALPAFLSYAFYQWARSPRYVVLAGDGSLDYRNYGGLNDSLVPTPPQGSPRGVFASDHFLGDVTGDGSLEMAIGRIPVHTPVQFSNFINKLVAFEQGGAWRGNVMISSDNSDQGGAFIQDANLLAAIITNRTIHRADIEILGVSNTAHVLQNAFNNGKEMIVYIGHGTFYRMAEEGILKTNDIQYLDNKDRAGIVGAMGCFMGAFGNIGSSTIGEKIITSDSGGTVMFGSAGLVTNDDSNKFARELAVQIYQNRLDRIGDAWVKAKNMTIPTTPHWGISTYQLLGDPATAVGSVTAPRGGPVVSPARPAYDTWIQWVFGNVWLDFDLSTDSGSDLDGDNYSNWEEYIAGTDPLDGDSRLVIVNTRRFVNGAVEVSWPSAPGRTYRVERSYAVVGGYETLQDNVPATAPINTLIDANPLPSGAVYRVFVK
ncbi:MAG TPA: C25 family cysteine peptidase, partial [Kiritimatiellia bacterium]|nr:C25 family cysteine peptidase [Kiritimatiellia bacterium]